MSTIARTIEVHSLPHGDAPGWVRWAWVGCTLPCEPECGHVPQYVGGVLSGPRLEKIDGFSVPQDKALEILAARSPKAAAWFRDHGFPRPKQCFRFKRKEVMVVETYSDEEASKLGPMEVYDDMETGTMRRMFI